MDLCPCSGLWISWDRCLQCLEWRRNDIVQGLKFNNKLSYIILGKGDITDIGVHALISGCRNRGISLYTEVLSFQGIHRYPHFRELEH